MLLLIDLRGIDLSPLEAEGGCFCLACLRLALLFLCLIHRLIAWASQMLIHVSRVALEMLRCSVKCPTWWWTALKESGHTQPCKGPLLSLVPSNGSNKKAANNNYLSSECSDLSFQVYTFLKHTLPVDQLLSVCLCITLLMCNYILADCCLSSGLCAGKELWTSYSIQGCGAETRTCYFSSVDEVVRWKVIR